MIRSTFFWKNFFAFVVVIGITAVTIHYSLAYRSRHFIEEETQSRLKETNQYLSALLLADCKTSHQTLQESLAFAAGASQSRITAIGMDGAVLAESDRDPALLDNHRHRPEIRQIVEQGLEWGSSVRYSDTVHKEMIYVSHRIQACDRNFILRIGLPVTYLHDRLVSMREIILPGIFFGGLIALILAWVLVRRIAGPIDEIRSVTEAMSQGQYNVRLAHLPNNEVGELGRSINRLAEAVQANIQQREKMADIRRQFTSNVSHELKTPLTSIRGYVETLLGGAIHDSSVNIRFLQIIQSNIDRLITLVNDLLQLARIEAEPEVDPKRLDMVNWRHVVDEVLSRHQIQLTQKNLVLELKVPEGGVAVRGERKAMVHIFENLLQNAINYSAPSGRITIKLERDAGRKLGILRVQDTGIGIDTSEHERIFERFYRVDAARSREVGGTGLGLAIVKHLVINLKGKIIVTSELGKGSTFSVELPVDKA